jgi:mRNA interferase RelE/StbE
MKINLSKQALKFLKSLGSKQQRQLSQKLISLSQEALPIDIKKIKGSDYLRTDSGEYRIVCNKADNVINIYVIGKRNDNEVYEIFNRKQKQEHF